MKSSLNLFLSLTILIGSCNKKTLEPTALQYGDDTIYFDQPTQVIVSSPQDHLRYTYQYTYKDQLLSSWEAYIDTSGHSVKEKFLIAEYEYEFSDNKYTRKITSQIVENNYLKFHEEGYTPETVIYNYDNGNLTKVETPSLTIEYFYTHYAIFDYILVDSSNITKDSIDVTFVSDSLNLTQAYNYKTFKGKGLNFNGDTSYHGYRTVTPLNSYLVDKGRNTFSTQSNLIVWHFSNLRVNFQLEVLNTFLGRLSNFNDGITSPLAYRLMPNFHTVLISVGWTQYRYDYTTDNAGRVVHITEWAPGPSDGLTLSRLIDIKY